MAEVQMRYFKNSRSKKPIKVNFSTDLNRAITLAQKHMQVNHYGAQVCEIVEMPGSIQHAVVKLHADGEVRMKPSRNLREYENDITVVSLAAWQEELDALNRGKK